MALTPLEREPLDMPKNIVRKPDEKNYNLQNSSQIWHIANLLEKLVPLDVRALKNERSFKIARYFGPFVLNTILPV